MKLIKDVTREKLPYHINITIRCERGQERAIDQLLETINPIDTSKDYDISIKPTKRKRSKDANAYLWELIGKLAKVHKPPLSKEEVYINYVRDYGMYTIVPIKEDHIDDWARIWKSKNGKEGIGWVTEDMGECRNIPGYHNIISYYGSSCYNTKEMSILIDAVVRDCKEQDIETMTPNQILELKQKWGCG